MASWCLAGRGLQGVSGGRGSEPVAGTMEDDDSYGEWDRSSAPSCASACAGVPGTGRGALGGGSARARE